MEPLLRVLGDGADRGEAEVPDGLEPAELVELFARMVLLRTFDERAVALQRQGRIGNYPPFWGEEATQIGPLHACEDDDWIFPSYRQNAIGLLRGIAASTPLKYRRGIGGPHGFYNPRRHRVGPVCIPIGTHLPHAVGAAYAAKLRAERAASLVWFGDGATSEGDFHEALNLAAVLKTATVFFCVNNQWAISTPINRQTATETIADKAAAYGMPGVRVDGFDVLACYAATRQALERGRVGEGPTLIEGFCYRIKGHATADDPSLYRDAAEAARWTRIEPVERLARFLRARGLLDEEAERTIRSEAERTISEAVSEMESITRPERDILFDFVYASGRPWTLEASD